MTNTNNGLKPQSWKSKAITYGTNILGRTAGNAVVDTFKNSHELWGNVVTPAIGQKTAEAFETVGNPWGALVNLGLDLAGISDKFRGSALYRVPKLAGTVFYATKALVDISQVFQGDYMAAVTELPFNVAMAYQTGQDLGRSYDPARAGKSRHAIGSFIDNLTATKDASGEKVKDTGALSRLEKKFDITLYPRPVEEKK